MSRKLKTATTKTAKLPVNPSVTTQLKCVEDEVIVKTLENGSLAVSLNELEVADIQAIRKDFATTHGAKKEALKVALMENAAKIKELQHSLELLKLKDQNERLMLNLLGNAQASMIDGYLVKIAASYGYPVGSYDSLKLGEDGTKFLLVPFQA